MQKSHFTAVPPVFSYQYFSGQEPFTVGVISSMKNGS